MAKRDAVEAARHPAKRRRPGSENVPNANQRRGDGAGSRKLLDNSQSKEVRQRIRQAYRALNRETLSKTEELAHLAGDAFGKMLSRTNALYDSVSFPSEAVHDTHQLDTLSRVGAAQAHAVTSSRSVRLDEMAEAMAKRWAARDGGVRWDGIGDEACQHIRSAPNCNFMNGPLAVKIKERRATQRAPKAALAAKVSPDLIEDANEEEKTQTDQRVEALHRVLKALPGAVPYFKFVVNPESYTQTVENMFDLSFLIKHAKASVFLRAGVPYVEARDMLQPEELGLEENRIKAVVLRITYRHFLDAVHSFQITEPIVPTRSVEAEARG